MTIETKELVISEELKRKVEMICRFAYIDYTIINGSVKSIKNTNIAMVKPHIVRIKNTNFLVFDDCDEIYDIAIDTSKEEELFDYADIDKFYTKENSFGDLER